MVFHDYHKKTYTQLTFRYYKSPKVQPLDLNVGPRQWIRERLKTVQCIGQIWSQIRVHVVSSFEDLLFQKFTNETLNLRISLELFITYILGIVTLTEYHSIPEWFIIDKDKRRSNERETYTIWDMGVAFVKRKYKYKFTLQSL